MPTNEQVESTTETHVAPPDALIPLREVDPFGAERELKLRQPELQKRLDKIEAAKVISKELWETVISV